MRAFFKGDQGLLGQMTTRLAGSSDLYAHSGRSPHASINFVTCHDGFTMRDLVSYNQKHNLLNLEDNRDGESNNHSWNCGVEGETDNPKVNALRMRQRRNLMAILMLSLGVPMISGGDEMGRTQKGNNNAYCQDNEISWTNWDLTSEEEDFLHFVQKLAAIRHSQPVLRRRKFFKGQVLEAIQEGHNQIKDIVWLNPDGTEMNEKDWTDTKRLNFGVLFEGSTIDDTDEDGRPIVGNTLLLLCNANWEDISYALPPNQVSQYWRMFAPHRMDKTWKLHFETSNKLSSSCWPLQSQFLMEGRTLALFELVDKDQQ
jgi:isoamylase